jgi:hypothetical protein
MLWRELAISALQRRIFEATAKALAMNALDLVTYRDLVESS